MGFGRRQVWPIQSQPDRITQEPRGRVYTVHDVARKRRKVRSAVKPREDTRGRDDILALVDRFGIAAEYRRIPDRAKASMYARCLPPLVTVELRAREDADAQTAAEGIREALREAKLVLGWLNDVTIPLQSVYTGLPHLQLFLRNFSVANPDHTPAARCRAVVDEVVAKAVPKASSVLEIMVISRLAPFQRFDRHLYGVRRPLVPRGPRNVRLTIRIFREPARRAHVEFDGISRPAYQCGGFLRPGKIDWVEWDADDPDGQGPTRPLPVLVQSHAIRNLCERLGMPETMGAAVLMFQSLLKPNVVVRNPDGSMLIECRSEVGRLGYFVVHLLHDRFLVNTFLFLTMKGTPEAEKLYARLRVTRHTVEMMKLDDLATFLLSDIRHDRQLAEVLTECGCGHLLTISDNMPFSMKALMRQAGHLRRILGWSQSDSEVEESTMEDALSTLKEMEEFMSRAEQTSGFLGRIIRRFKG